MRIFLFFFILSLSQLQAQNILISGKVIIDEDNSIELNDIDIINLSSNAKTKTNTKGLFSIKVNENDELLFSGVNVEERRIKISSTILQKGFFTVHLNIKIIELAEANVNRLDKNMLNKLGKEKTFQEKFNTKLGINTIDFKIKLNLKQEEAKANRTINQIGGVSFIGLFNLLSGSYKDINPKSEVIKTKENLIKDLNLFYTDYYFIKDLKIPKNSIISFIDYCYTNYNFKQLLKENKYDDILLILEEQAPIYLRKINTNPTKNDK